jgi:1-acyl-sn-glycerol-3-phosphate acyltransferase
MAEVSPKDMKPQVYKDPRPAEMFTKFHRSARRGVGWIYDFVRVILTLPTILIYRARAIGVENVPWTGPVILAPNHFSQWDHFFAAVYLRRKVQFMAKSQLFTNPAIKYIFKHGGVFPVRRGHHDDEAFVTANAILDRGGTMLMYAEGGRSRTGDLGEPKQDRPRVRRPGGAGRDPRLGRRPGLAPVPLPEGDNPVRRADDVPGKGGPKPRGGAAGREPDLRPCPRDVRRSRGERPPRCAAAAARGSAGDVTPS